MSNSLRAKLSKLRHDGHITDAEYQAFVKKMDGHDRVIYDKGYSKGYAEGKSRQLFAEIKIDKDMLQEMIDEKIKEFEVDIQATRNKAIDEYMNALCDKCMDMKNECYQLECPFCDDGCDIVNIAEKMKGGA